MGTPPTYSTKWLFCEQTRWIAAIIPTSAWRLVSLDMHGWYSSFRIPVVNTLQWRHNGRDGILNHQPDDCLLNRLFRHRSKKTSKLRVTDLCAGNPPMTGEFPAQMTSNAANVSIWWRHYEKLGQVVHCRLSSIVYHNLCWRFVSMLLNDEYCWLIKA